MCLQNDRIASTRSFRFGLACMCPVACVAIIIRISIYLVVDALQNLGFHGMLGHLMRRLVNAVIEVDYTAMTRRVDLED